MGRAEDAKKAKEAALKARIAARKEEAEKKAKEDAEKLAQKRARARARWPITRHLKSRVFKGAVIVFVTSIDQALLAQDAGATAVCAFDSSMPAAVNAVDTARMPNPEVVRRYMDAVMIPVITSVRIGHITEAKIMEQIGSNMVDESNLFNKNATLLAHINKTEVGTPTICAVSTLAECLLRIQEGALILRTAGEFGGNVHMAIEVLHNIRNKISEIKSNPEIRNQFKMENPTIYEPLLEEVLRTERLPVMMFGAGGIATPSDVAMMINNGCEGIYVDNEVFLKADPYAHIKNIIAAAKASKDVSKLCDLSAAYF